MKDRDRWLSFGSDAQGGRTNLFCFPFAGGGASFYRPWARLASNRFAIVPVQLPGREERLFDSSFEQMGPLVDAAADALLPFLRTPYALFGHSMGGMIAYELLQELDRRSAPSPMHLFVSGAPAPHLAAQIPAIYHLPEPELINEIRLRYQGLPAEVLHSRELLDLLLPRLRADLSVTGRYIYRDRPPVSCPITAFGGCDDPTVTPPMIEGWREHTASTFRVEIFPGGHFFPNDFAARMLFTIGEHLR
jgi:medium-chain acyl-[acyl-carrier-protein] hydrolase